MSSGICILMTAVDMVQYYKDYFEG